MTEKPANDPSVMHDSATSDAGQGGVELSPLNGADSPTPPVPKFNFNASIEAYMRRKWIREDEPQHILDYA